MLKECFSYIPQILQDLVHQISGFAHAHVLIYAAQAQRLFDFQLLKYLRYIASLIIIFITFSSFANFTIMPIELEINKNNKIAVMTLQNNDVTEKRFQLKILKKEHKDGKEEYKPTKDLIATPVMFKVESGKMQLIRVAIKDKENISQARDVYRISVQELPHRIKIDNNITSTVDFIIEFNVPIIISG